MKKKTKKRIAKLEERVKSLEVAALRAPARPNEKRLMALEHALAFNFYTLVAVSRRGQPSPMDQVVAQAIATQKRLDITIVNLGNEKQVQLELSIKPYAAERYA